MENFKNYSSLPLPSLEEEAAILSEIKSVYKKPFVFLITGANDATYLSDYATNLARCIFTYKIQESVIFRDLCVLAVSGAHGRASPKDYQQCAHRRNLICDNFMQELALVGHACIGNVKVVPVLFSDQQQGCTSYTCSTHNATIYIPKYSSTGIKGVVPVDYDVEKDGSPIENIPVVRVCVPGNNSDMLSRNEEPSGYQGIKSILSRTGSIVSGGMDRASQMVLKRSPGEDSTMSLNTDPALLKSECPHSSLALFLPIIGGFISKYDDEFIREYKSEGISEETWNEICNITDEMDIDTAADIVVKGMEEIIVHQVKRAML